MFNRIADYELPMRDFCLTKVLIFLFLFNSFLFNDLKINVKNCFDVRLFYYISRTRTAYCFSLLGQLVLYTYGIF